jgi:transposase InsO family protein
VRSAAEASAEGQRARANRVGAAGPVPVRRHPNRLHRTGLTVAESYVESFNGRARDELLNVEEFGSLTEAQVVVQAWRTEYNNYRPHSALDGLTPAEYAGQWTIQQQPALS